MPSVGSVTAFSVRGRAPSRVEKVERYERSGYDGFGLHAQGTRGVGQMTVIKHDSLANIETFFADLEALVGAASVTITDDFGEAESGCFIIGVSGQSRTPIIGPAGETTRGECIIEVVRSSS